MEQKNQDGPIGRHSLFGRWWRPWIASSGLGQGVVLVAATTLAYGLDYLFNLLAGRQLEPSEFGIVVALAGAGQIMVVSSRVVQTVVTRYVSGFQVAPGAAGRMASFFRTAFAGAWILGLAVMVLLALASWSLADFWQIPTVAPVLALAAAALLMAVRPVVGGILQGEQRFATLGAIQVFQALVRLGLGAALIAAGLGAFGAVLALPIAIAATLVLGLFLLGRGVWRLTGETHGIAFSDISRYSSLTALGLIGYALLVNMDAILVKRFFDPTEAGYYSAAITLAKIIQFFPLAIIQILFSKAARRHAARQDPVKALLPAMLIVFVLCGGLALLYALFPTRIVHFVFGSAYQLDGRVLGTLGLAMAFLSLTNVWLNYFLSVERMSYTYLIWIGVIIQFVLISFYHDALWQLPTAMALSGLGLAVAGAVTLLRQRSGS